jgi:hypothetical protein
MVKEDFTILSFSAKWLGSDDVVYFDTGGRGAKKVRDDSKLLSELWKVLDEADIVVGQNVAAFDLKKINTRLIAQGFHPYSPVRVVDTMLVAKRHFGFTSTKLAWLSRLTPTRKSEHKKYPGFALWEACLRDEKAAWAEMKAYNQRDVEATENLYLKLRPWIDGHPNVAVYSDSEVSTCPKCGSERLENRGFVYSQSAKFKRFRCRDCGGNARAKSNVLLKGKRASLVGN